MAAISKIIESRRTLKVMADPASPWPLPDEEFHGQFETMLEEAAWAPFHYACHAKHQELPCDSPVPWRFHALTAASCRQLLKELQSHRIESGKIANMLAAAHAMVMTTWLPDPDDTLDQRFQGFAANLRNMEHIAAASAAVQNLLLLATEAGFSNYWSSGGVLRSEQLFRWLEIPDSQILLGAIFVFPRDTGEAATKPGANRGKRGESRQWMRWVKPGLESDGPHAVD